MQTDADIVAAVLAGRREAFADLVRRHEHAVHAAAIGVVREHHTAQDICQEAFVAAYRGLGTLRDPASFGSWVVRIARNRALTFMRLLPTARPLDAMPDPPFRTMDESMDADGERLLAAIMELPDHERTVVMLRYFADHSLESIAGMMGAPVGTVGAQLHRARQRLRSMLEEVTP